ncbi:MAG: hypothetical protein LUD43_08410 [Firmicutes bacterium]|nr:hypothetical protein [Bacillota bacterium]
MKCSKSKGLLRDFNDNVPCRVKTSGQVVQIMQTQHMPNESSYIERIDKETYLVKRTGEVKQINHQEKRIDNIQTVKHSLEDIRDIINCNVTEPEKWLWVTLTYAENMQDYKRLYPDLQKLIQKLRYHYGDMEYILVPEPQKRGAWHIHSLFGFPNKAPFIANDFMRALWGQGFVNVQAVRGDCDNFGAYLSAYLGDLAIDDYEVAPYGSKVTEKEVTEMNGKKKSKRVIKGGRLALYPAGMRMYRCSRGIKKPVIERMNPKDAKEKVKGHTPTFTGSAMLSDDESGFQDCIIYLYYNLNRKEKYTPEDNEIFETLESLYLSAHPRISSYGELLF